MGKKKQARLMASFRQPQAPPPPKHASISKKEKRKQQKHEREQKRAPNSSTTQGSSTYSPQALTLLLGEDSAKATLASSSR